MKPRISINIGLNTPGGGRSCAKQTLKYAKVGAEQIRDIAAANQWNVSSPYGAITGDAAVLKRVRDAFDQAVTDLKDGGYLLLSFAGHSCQLPDTNGDEHDHLDEAWCLADQPLLDDELWERLAAFGSDVRIQLVLDTCFSGGDVNQARLKQARTLIAQLQAIGVELGTELRDSFALAPFAVDDEEEAFSREVQAQYPLGRRALLRAGVVVFASCGERYLSQDGAFTSEFCAACASATPPATFNELYLRVCQGVRNHNGWQIPTYYPAGNVDKAFLDGPPFPRLGGM